MLCESAQRYRALMVILQLHRTQNMILRCYPNVSAILQRHTKSCLLCFFNNPYISHFEFTEFFIYLSLLFFYMLCSTGREHSSRSFAPPKKWLFSMVTWGTKCASARTCARRAQAQNIIAAAKFLSCTVQSAERVARR